MKSCTHCNHSLTDYRKSGKIPGSDNLYYICCYSCGNVMIAHIEYGEILNLRSTPTDNSIETHRMIDEATKLFNESGNTVRQVVVNKNTNIEDKEKDKIVYLDNYIEPEVIEEEQEIIKTSFIKKMINKLINFRLKISNKKNKTK